MINMTDTVYDVSTDGIIAITPGTYPAHVSSFEGRTVQTKFGEQKVFNIEFQIADEVSKMTIIKHGYVEDELMPVEDEDGNEVKISASFNIVYLFEFSNTVCFCFYIFTGRVN